VALSLFVGSNVEVFIFVKEEYRRTRGDIFNCMKLEWGDGKDKLGPLQRGYLKQ